MSGGLALLGGRAEADLGAAGNQNRFVGILRLLQRGGDRRRIVAVDPRCIPARGLETLDLVDTVGERQRAID